VSSPGEDTKDDERVKNCGHCNESEHRHHEGADEADHFRTVRSWRLMLGYPMLTGSTLAIAVPHANS